jgi:N-acyl amino acid synthase of PEP-CTERM/exosortase system
MTVTAPEILSTSDGFKKYFEILPALSLSEKQATFRIRHSVYSEDLGWEARRADGMETDAYDPQSLHCLIRSRASGNFIGCVRLILAKPEDPLAPLPLERTCRDVLDRSIIDPATLPRTKIAEISRLAIVAQYRRRSGEERTPGTLQDSDFGTADGLRFPYLLVGLYMGVFAIADIHGLEKLFLLSEPRLARHLNRIGITNERIGAATEHRGLRLPSVMDVRRVIDHLRPSMHSVFVVVRDELEAAYRTASDKVDSGAAIFLGVDRFQPSPALRSKLPQ